MRVDQRRRRRRARRRSGSKRGRARRELLAVARQLEARIDAVADDVGEVVDEQAGEVARAVGRRRARRTPTPSGSSPSPASASSAAKRGPSGRNARPTMRSARLGIAALQEPHDRLDRRRRSVVAARRGSAVEAASCAASRARFSSAGTARQPVAREQPQEQLDRRIRLRHLEPSRAACWRRNPVRYAVAGYGVLSWVIGGVTRRTRISGPPRVAGSAGRDYLKRSIPDRFRPRPPAMTTRRYGYRAPTRTWQTSR